MVFISKCHIVQGSAVLEKPAGDRNVSRVESLQKNFALLRIWIYNSPKVPGILLRTLVSQHLGIEHQAGFSPSVSKKPQTSKQKDNEHHKPLPLQNLKPYHPKNINFLKKFKTQKDNDSPTWLTALRFFGKAAWLQSAYFVP